MRDFAAYCLRFQTQADAYAMLLTLHYPSLNLGLETPDTQTQGRPRSVESPSRPGRLAV